MSRRVLIAALLLGSVTVAGSDTVWSVSSTGSLAVAMESASAVTLANGNVVVFGDEAGAPPELYDTATGSFLPLPVGPSPAAGAAGVRLNDGRVLAVGGLEAGHASSRAMVFDAATGMFGALDASMTVGRATPMVVLLADGRVLIAGGTSDAGLEASAEIFDPATAAFSATGAMAVAQLGTATLLPDGRVLIAGGTAAGGGVTSAAEIFDASGAFAATGSLTTARNGHQAALLADGRVLIAGGADASGVATRDAEVFDPASGMFTRTGSMTEARVDHRAAVLTTGEVLIAGGRNGNGAMSSVEIYSPATSTFAPIADLREPRWSSAAARLADGRVVVAGGHGAAGTLVSADLIQATDVTPVKASATFTSAPLARQYSDRVTLTATVTPANAAQSVTFRIGTQVLATVPIVLGTATTSAQVLITGIGAKIVTAEFQASPGYTVAPLTRPLTVLREDAQVPATPPRTVNTGCGTCRTTTVRLEATVNDISLASPATDPDPGDIGLATVSFVNRATGVTIATVPVVANPSDHRTGKATYDWAVNLGTASSQTFTIGVVVGNQYIRNNVADDMKITVVKR